MLLLDQKDLEGSYLFFTGLLLLLHFHKIMLILQKTLK